MFIIRNHLKAVKTHSVNKCLQVINMILRPLLLLDGRDKSFFMPVTVQVRINYYEQFIRVVI